MQCYRLNLGTRYAATRVYPANRRHLQWRAIERALSLDGMLYLVDVCSWRPKQARTAIVSGTDDATALAVAAFAISNLSKDHKAALSVHVRCGLRATASNNLDATN
jgi:hypothetical protein